MLDQPAETMIDASAAAGFDGVGLRLSGEHRVARPDELRRRAVDLGVIVFDVEVHRVSATSPDPGPLLDAALEAGAEAVLVVSDDSDRDRTIEALFHLMIECTTRRLVLGLEYMAWTTPSDPTTALEIAREVGCHLVVDVLHHARVGADTAELDAIIRSGRLGWLQLCDAAPPAVPPPRTRSSLEALLHEARHGRRAPGDGALRLRELVERLPADTTVSVEVQSDELVAIEPFERARRLHAAARSVLHD